MKDLLATLLGRFHRARGTVETRAPSGQDASADQRLSARALSDAIDRAMQLGLWEHADRLSKAAARLVSVSPRLAERIARLRLAQGQAETALSIIESTPVALEAHASLRLLRAACLVQIGRRQEAHSDLMRWSRRSTAPLDARLMLALLEWDAGDDHAAALALMRNLRHLEDPRSLELLLLLAAHQGRREQAKSWADRLYRSTAFGGEHPYLDLLCGSLQLSPLRHGVQPTNEQIDTLAMELLTAEETIPSLLESLRLRPQRDVAQLLYAGVERALDDLTDQAKASEMLARLAQLLDDHDGAIRWAQRGLKLNPLSASLTLLLSELRSSPDVGDQPRQELAA